MIIIVKIILGSILA